MRVHSCQPPALPTQLLFLIPIPHRDENISLFPSTLPPSTFPPLSFPWDRSRLSDRYGGALSEAKYPHEYWGRTLYKTEIPALVEGET